MEANTFAPGETTLDDLRAQVFGIGADLHRDFMGPESELAGAWAALEEAGVEVVPSLAAWSGPGRPLAAGVLDELCRLVLAPLDDTRRRRVPDAARRLRRARRATTRRAGCWPSCASGSGRTCRSSSASTATPT